MSADLSSIIQTVMPDLYEICILYERTDRDESIAG